MELQTRFCTSLDGTDIAYATVGDGRPLVYSAGWPACVDQDWEWAEARASYEAIASRHLLVYPHPRGVGASQREVDDLSLEAQLADLEAVIESLGIKEFDLLGQETGAATSLAYAARHPERVGRIVLWHPVVYGEDAGRRDSFLGLIELTQRNWRMAREAMADASFPSGPIEWRRFAADYFRESVSKEIAAMYWQTTLTLDARSSAALVQAPTLVLHRKLSRSVPVAASRAAAALIPDARLVSLDGDASFIYFNHEQVSDSIIDFLDRDPKPGTGGLHGMGFRTILFTDMESSTALTQQLGDAAGQEVRRTHNDIVRAALNTNGGLEIKHTGDGIMASFATASSALDCAIAIQRGVADHVEAHPDTPLGLYIGLNAGEPIAEDDDLFGTSVDLAARLVDHAQPGQIIASDVVRQLAAGKDFLFSDLGDTELRGFEDPVKLWEVRWRDGD